MPTETKDPLILFLPEVRLGFPALWTPRTNEKNAAKAPQFEASFIFDNTQHGTLLDKIDATIDRLALDEWKKKVNFRRCLRDGNEYSETDGYGDGKSFLKAWSLTRPGVVGRKLEQLTEADGIIYAGCFVNATVRLFAYDHPTGGKGISATLNNIQFVKDGPAFGANKTKPEDDFKALDSDDATGTPHGTTTRSRSGGRSGAAPSTNLNDY